jgi:DNA-binding FadR family transcriptional regulator
MSNPGKDGQRTLAETLTGQIREWILNGTYGPGEKLPPERRLATLLGVNRGSLRLALKKLEQHGLLQSRQGDGTRVRDLREAGGLELLPFLFQSLVSRQHEVLRDVLELRVMVGTYLAGLAAARQDSGDGLERLDALLERLETAADAKDRLRADFDIFWEYARLGGSVVGQLLVNTVRGPFELHSAPFERMASDGPAMARAAREIADSVVARRIDEARARAETYLRAGTDRALQRGAPQ